MNAPTLITDLTAEEPTLEYLPLDNLRPSPLHVQTLRRQRFDPQALLELAASIKAIGVAQPIVARPVPVHGHVRFEIVAGERRWIAADRAGLGHIPAVVRELTDEQCLEIQLVENLQREGLHPLEEGAGYRELMDMKRIDAEAVGAMVGKSRSYVYSRTKLLDLCPAAREALQAGTLDASKALLIARLPGDKLQTRATHLLTVNAAHYSYKQALRKIRDDFMVPLATAPFRQDDAALTTKQHTPLPACTHCPQRSGNDAELLDGLDGDENICTDKQCFELKARAYRYRERVNHIAAGGHIIGGEAAAALVPLKWAPSFRNGHLNLAGEAEDIDLPGDTPQPVQAKGESDDDYNARLSDWEDFRDARTLPTWRSLLGDDIEGTVLVEGQNGMLHALLPAQAAVKALKAKGLTPPERWTEAPQKPLFRDPADEARMKAEQAREQERQKVEAEYRARLFKAVALKWKGPLKRADLDNIVEALGLRQVVYAEGDDLLIEVFGGKIDCDKLNDADLLRLIALQPLAAQVEQRHEKPGRLLEAAHRFNIDPKKIRAQVIADLKPTSVAPEDKPKPAAKKKAAKK